MSTPAAPSERPGDRLVLPVDDEDHVAGARNAPVVLVEYGDFECPYCGQAYPVVEELRRRYPDDLAFVFRDFPLVEIHPHALPAAKAAEAAGLQRQFWSMYAVLFTHQDALDPASMLVYARTVGLDLRRFIDDVDSDAVERKIRRDAMSGVASGVPGTPTFFVNGVRHTGGFGLRELSSALEAAMHRART
ncbi:MAG TPA: thioredoxin domain-containing protein [Acidimicrobiia bacterium]|jgi:protein-disulfide isomerase